MVTASPLTATGTLTLATAIPVAMVTLTLATAIPVAMATLTLATAIPVAMATPTLAIPVATGTATATKGIATAATKGIATAATKGIATAATKGTATAATKGTAMAATEGTATVITGYRKSKRHRGDAVNKWRLVQKLLLFEIVRVPRPDWRRLQLEQQRRQPKPRSRYRLAARRIYAIWRQLQLGCSGGTIMALR
jgi:hypothetical protein